MSPTSKWTPASSSSDMIRRSRRASVPRSNAVTSAPSRTSARTVHAPIQPSAPVTRKRSLAVVMRGRWPCGPVSGASNRPAPAPQRSASGHANDGSNGIFVPGVTSIEAATGRGPPCPTNRSRRVRIGEDRSRDHPARFRVGAGRRAVPEVGDDEARRRSNGPGRSGSATSTSRPSTAMGPPSVGSEACCRAGHETTSSLSTKVGRLVRPTDRIPPGADIDRQALAGRDGCVLRRDAMAGGSSSTTARTVWPVARGESRAARARADRHGLHPRSRRPLAGRDRRRLSRRCTGSVSRVSSVPSAWG